MTEKARALARAAAKRVAGAASEHGGRLTGGAKDVASKASEVAGKHARSAADAAAGRISDAADVASKTIHEQADHARAAAGAAAGHARTAAARGVEHAATVDGTAAGHARLGLAAMDPVAAAARRARRLRNWGVGVALAGLFVYGVAVNTPKALADYLLEREKQQQKGRKGGT